MHNCVRKGTALTFRTHQQITSCVRYPRTVVQRNLKRARTSLKNGVASVVEQGVRGVARARRDVTMASRRDISKRSGHRPAVL